MTPADGGDPDDWTCPCCGCAACSRGDGGDGPPFGGEIVEADEDYYTANDLEDM